MSMAKGQIKQILELQPDDSSYEEILKELAFKRMIDKGLLDVESGNTISNKEMEHRIKLLSSRAKRSVTEGYCAVDL